MVSVGCRAETGSSRAEGVEGGVFTCGFGAESDQLLSVTVLGGRRSVYPKAPFSDILFFMTVSDGHILLLKKDTVCSRQLLNLSVNIRQI